MSEDYNKGWHDAIEAVDKAMRNQNWKAVVHYTPPKELITTINDVILNTIHGL